MSSQEYEMGVSLNNGEVLHFGPYETAKELRAEVEPFCEEQLKLGNMEQQDFDRIMSDLKCYPE